MSRLAINAIQDLIPDEKGNNTIVVIIDTFSRFLELYPTNGVQGTALARALLAHIGRYGIPFEVISDRGSAFMSAIWEDMVKAMGVEHILTTAYSKEENGIVERANQEVMRHL
jgi:transposase InsO family protein